MHPVPALPLHRYQLARLAHPGWQRVLAREWDPQARECLAHWSAHDLPLVVTRQPAARVGCDAIALGLAAPGRWGRRRLALTIARGDVRSFSEFPRADEVLPPALSRALTVEGTVVRVHGSHGWQHLTGLDHVRATSDIDLWIAVDGAAPADAMARRLQSLADAAPRLDGELVFPDGSAVAWREWLAWRDGHAGAVLVKRLDGVDLLRALGEAA